MFTEEIRAVRDFFRQEGRVIRQAWATFIIGWLIFSAIVFGIPFRRAA
jgi:hypothetical protein